jgi:hypothetical protein
LLRPILVIRTEFKEWDDIDIFWELSWSSFRITIKWRTSIQEKLQYWEQKN